MILIKSWKAQNKESSEPIHGITLTTNGFGEYRISNLDPTYVVLNHIEGIPVKKETLYWECNRCYNFNHYTKIICDCCGGKIAGR